MIVNVRPSGPPAMGSSLAKWFVFRVLVGSVPGRLAGLMLAPGADYRPVFRVASTAAFLAYTVGGPVDYVWKGRKASTTLKHAVGGLVHSLLAAGVFGRLWLDA